MFERLEGFGFELSGRLSLLHEVLSHFVCLDQAVADHFTVEDAELPESVPLPDDRSPGA